MKNQKIYLNIVGSRLEFSLFLGLVISSGALCVSIKPDRLVEIFANPVLALSLISGAILCGICIPYMFIFWNNSRKHLLFTTRNTQPALSLYENNFELWEIKNLAGTVHWNSDSIMVHDENNNGHILRIPSWQNKLLLAIKISIHFLRGEKTV